jgi:putative peptidoglycan lipid II flippase
VIAFGTVISRILGLVRDNVILSLFPVAVTDPFFVAFRIPNTLRRLFAEGALSSAFIPVFSRARHEDSEEEVSRFAGSLFRFLFVVLLGISVLGILAAPFVIRILAPGFTEDQDLFDLTVRLTRIMFPFILLIGLAALTMGMLNTFHRFFVPSVASAFLNLAIIGGAAGSLLYYRGNASITCVAGGVLVGGVLQWLVQWFDLRNATPVALGGSGWWHPRIWQVAVLFLPAVLGQAVMQLNILVDTYFASRIAGGNTYLYAANRIMQFPLGVYGIAVATAAFPRLSGLAAAGDREAFSGTFDRAVRGILFVLAPCAVGLAFFGRDAIGLLFNHGKFEAEGSLEPTLWALWAYITGLVVFAAVKVAVSACYAMSDTRWPLWTGTAAVAANIVLDAVLVRTPLAHAGLALATSISSFINLILLMLVLRYSHRVDGILRPFGLMFRAFGAALVASLPLYLFLEAAFPAGLSTTRFAVRTLAAMAVGAGLYIGAARWLMAREWREIKQALGGRR